MLLAAWLLAVNTASATPSHAACVHYEPDTARITGTLTRHAFYGAPGFGDDPKRDVREVGFYLDLTAPLCTIGGAGNESKKGVRRVQLVLDSAGYDRLRPALGKTVTLRGTLLPAMSGHHHAPVLLRVFSK